MTCTSDTHHRIQLFQLDKIGKLQGSHADNASYGSFNNCIIRRYVFRFHTSWHQSIMKRLTFFILRVLNVKQTSLIRISYFKPLGIFRNNLHNRRICLAYVTGWRHVTKFYLVPEPLMDNILCLLAVKHAMISM